MTELVVPAEIVPELRRGLLVAMGSAAERLAMLSLPGELTHLPTYHSALWTVMATSALLEKVGVAREDPERAVVLLEDDYAYLLYRSLRARHESIQRLRQDAAVSLGVSFSAGEDTLGQFVENLRRRLSGGEREQEERRLLVAINTGHVES